MHPDELMALAQGFLVSRALQVANRVGLFRVLADGPKDAATIARSLKTDPEACRLLCNALTGQGILAHRGRRYRLPASLAPSFSADGDESLVPYLNLAYDQWETVTRLEEKIRTGRPLRATFERLKHDARWRAEFTHAMHSRASRSADLVGAVVDLRGVRRLLDLGGGPGTYALEWAKRLPRLEATIFDLPGVLRVTRRYIRRYGLGDRVRTRGGDFLADPLGRGYDLVLLANILQMYGPKESRDVLRKVYEALGPGGRIVIHGHFTDAAGSRPREAALFSLFIATVTPRGRSHALPAVLGWLRAAGFRGLRTEEIADLPRTVIIGIRPPARP